ncbi:blast:Zinc finger protein 782 [Drosophila guanche]|uniref:Blast:Zinc finger protein 782 n=1 Tax=Drosophila guanche TaxID=7266 RepID=A0A3B0KIA6_DROGU|nr:blast:Zinc finger protein 782 [Drosophila guanche]
MPCVFQLHPSLHQQQQHQQQAQHQHQHQHPHQELSLSTPVHALETDTNFTSFFDDDIVTCGSTSSSAIWLPIQLGNGNPNGAINATNKAAAEVPFVQIHTTDLQQQAQPEKSYRNAFRRRTAEIKSEELIKSELAEAAAKERLNATPTPPTRNSSCASVEGKAMVQEVPILFRCPNCPFLSLCQVKSSQHVNNCFGTSAEQQRQCPGCPNIFYSSDALNVHLSLDHQLDDDECVTLLGGTGAGAPEVSGTSTKQTLPKSRIFIKSVDCLREPQQDFLPLLQQQDSEDSPVTSSNILDLLDDVAETPGHLPPSEPVAPPCQKPSQKISIKSVDVLREPALLTFDFQLPNGCQEMPLLADSNLVDAHPVVETEKPHQPKIYIRNVDILKEPMLLPSSLPLPLPLPGMGYSGGVATTTAMQNGAGGVGGTAGDVFQADTLLTPTGPLPGFEPSLAPLASMCSEPFPFDSVLSVGGGGGGGGGGVASTLENTRFSALDLDFGVDFEHGIAPLLTEATPPPMPMAPPQPQCQPAGPAGLSGLEQPVELQHYLPPTPSTTKQKIFIKNVDILKAPQRGTLHLRTVDELNFMTRNEVERLIVPNLEPMPKMEPLMDQQQQHTHTHTHTNTHTQPQSQPQPLDSLQLEPQNSQTLSDFQAPLSGSWPSEDSYDLAGDLECWPWIEEAVQEVIPSEAAAGAGDAAASASASEPQVESLGQSSDDFPQLYPSTTEPVQSGEDAMPPLVPVSASDSTAVAGAGSGSSSLPLPPLVPLAAEAGEKPGRIYVANNLLPAAVDPLPGGTSVRGRPYGTKLTAGGGGGGKRKAAPSISQVAEGGKCQVEGCMFRFKSPATLEYHGRCHNDVVGSSQPMVCPECRSSDFSNWNCLHTHLWRTHQIDMELYCCQLCSFKTPIYSRLVNTHAKIHSEERNYKCEQCGKGFKNTKQLKNHRRLHRTQGLGMGKGTLPDQATADSPPTAILHRCGDCGAAFKQRKTLREHLCKERNEQPQCSLCQRVFSSKSSLKLHLRSHQANKRFQCDTCEYEASDHNAFRRHLATHRDRKRYACPHCDFRAIQSTAFRIHLQKRHPEQELSSIIYKCDQCSFSSINQGLLLVHQAKHEHEAPPHNQQSLPVTLPEAVPVAVPATLSTPSSIKVETSLLLAHSSTNVAKMQAGVTLGDVLQSS